MVRIGLLKSIMNLDESIIDFFCIDNRYNNFTNSKIIVLNVYIWSDNFFCTKHEFN